jgi:hypothetical protein
VAWLQGVTGGCCTVPCIQEVAAGKSLRFHFSGCLTLLVVALTVVAVLVVTILAVTVLVIA